MTQQQQELLQQQQQNGCGRGQTGDSSTLGLSDGYSRLRSFSPTTWFGKPPELSPQACASKGWANTGPDQLTCVSCSAQILCKLPLNPWAEGAAGVVRKYATRLVDAHSQGCRQRSMLLSDQQQHTTPSAGQQAPRNSSSTSLSFPILPMPKLYGAYNSRRQELQQLQLLPEVPASTRALLAAAAARLDPSILSGLAALLQLPVDQLRQEAAATVVVATGSTNSSSSTAVHSSRPGGRGGGCPREQALSLIALCGWQPRQLLPPHLLPAAAADASGSLLGVAHLLPRRSHSSAGQAPAAAAAAQGGGSATGSAVGGSISPACTALECELCGSQVGLWKFSCSGPFYAQQLSSKAMRTLAATAAASSAATAAAAAAAEAEAEAPSAQQAAADSTPAPDQQQLRRAPSGSGAGGVSPAGSSMQQASASPEAVFAAMSHTIAGGSLLTAGASGGGSRPASMEAGGPSSQQQQQQLQPFGSAAAPAFGSPPAVALGSAGKPPVAAAGGGSRLFEGLAAVPAASVLGSPAPVAPTAAGPFGAAVAGLDKDAAAPVFGLQAFEVEEQRTKRRRSSATGPDFAAAAAAAIAAHAAAGPTSPGDAAAGQHASTPATPAAGGPNGTALQHPPPGGAGGSAGRGVRAYSKQRSGLAAAVAAATGDAGAADEAVFDPIAAHRSWCPWVKESSRPGSSAGSNAGLVAAVRLGWAATVMAVQDAAQEQELAQLAQQPGADGAAVQRDDYSSTAAVLERARQAMELLERDV